MTGDFEAIRPYSDAEVRPVLERLLADEQFIGTLTHYRFPQAAPRFGALLRPLVRWVIRRELRGVDSVHSLQARIEPYVDRSIEKATDGITYSGLENLRKDRPYLFIANHRDIVMDPAFVNYALFHAGLPTPRIAIGDNLLQKPFVSDLMRLNKCFIVPRSVTGRREKLAAYQTLSAYINHSLRQENASIWIAQAEGRAKDGDDRTDPAILKMFHMSCKDEEFADSMQALQIVPVSICYEYDPCDMAKARELGIRAATGSYAKEKGEDDRSIATGITGYKGRVHVHFSPEISAPDNDPRLLAQRVDAAILGNFRLYPVNHLAWEQWEQRDDSLQVPAASSLFPSGELAAARAEWQRRLQACPEQYRSWLITQYANPVRNQYQLTQAG